MQASVTALMSLLRHSAKEGSHGVDSLGLLEMHEMPGALARAGVVTLLSEYESHPVAVMEALAARRPVVVLDSTGFRELAEDGLVRAIPVAAGPGAAAAAIIEELDRPSPAEAPALPTWADTTDALEALYRRMAGR